MHSLSGGKILVVGGAGFIGSNLACSLIKKRCRRIHIIDNLLSSERKTIPRHPSVTFLKGSIQNSNVINTITDSYDVIFHVATFHGNQNSIARPLEDHKNNALTTLTLFDHIKHFKKLKKVIYTSAGCVSAKKTFNKPVATVEHFGISLHQDSPYAISKIMGEFYSLFYTKQWNVPIVIARFQNVYGPGEILGAGQWRGTPATVWRNVIPTFIYKAIKQEPLPVEGGGQTSRDFIFVDDICRGLIACALKGTPGEIYNLATNQETSIYDLAVLINQLTHNTAGMIHLPSRSWDRSGRRRGSVQKAKRDLEFMAQIPIPEGLAHTIDWTEKSIALIDRCIAKHSARVKKNS